MPCTRLIVNADDLGNGEATDRGIFTAFADGIVSSASLLASGPSWRTAARRALTEGLPLGVHLNLSEGMAVSGPIGGLTDPDGRFPGKIAVRARLAAGGIEPTAISREFIAQIEQVRAAGVIPDHLDTHQHCALFPAVAAAFCNAARACGIQLARLPVPAEDDSAPPELADDLALYRRLAPGLAHTLRQAGCRTPQGLYGMPMLNHLNETQLLALLARLPAGDWELMVHPGYHDPCHPFATVAREVELAALTAPAVRAAVTRHRIALISFADLPCAC